MMSLRKKPVVTPGMLAANRLNARKSTGPRTSEGKKRTRFNSFQDGAYAKSFREVILSRGGDVALYDRLLANYRRIFSPPLRGDAKVAEHLAREAWLEGTGARCQVSGTMSRSVGQYLGRSVTQRAVVLTGKLKF